MFCNKCGNELKNNEKFCPLCGNKIEPKETPLNDSPKQEETVSQSPSISLQGNIQFLNKTYTIEHLVYAISALVLLISCILPYVSVSFLGSSKSMTILESDMGYTIPVFAILGIIAFVLKNEFMMMWFSLINLILALLIQLTVIVNMREIGFGNLSIGCYLIMFASIIFFITGCHLSIKFKKRKEERSLFMNFMVTRFKIGFTLLAILVIMFIIMLIVEAFSS